MTELVQPSDQNQSQPPDTDFCFRAQTANLLALSIAQIHMSLTEGDNSVGTLAQSFQDLANFCSKVESLATDTDLSSKNTEIISIATDMSSQVNTAIVAFQFYDRLCQRMSHVAGSLDHLAGLLQHDDTVDKSEGWQALRDHIKQQYTMKAEHQMYDLIMQGSSPEQALAEFKAAMENHNDEDDIELF